MNPSAFETVYRVDARDENEIISLTRIVVPKDGEINEKKWAQGEKFRIPAELLKDFEDQRDQTLRPTMLFIL